MNGALYIVATPIGNLQDITLRAIEMLGKVEYIACEDTRKSAVLINKFFPNKKREMIEKLFSYYEQVEQRKIPQVLNLLKNGKDVALISDAGTPTISDPGFKLVRECLRENIKVFSIPGPSSVISSLVSSGLPTDKFTFLGFLPQKSGHRNTLLKNLKKSQGYISSTIIIFESPYKIYSTLTDIKTVFGDIEVVIIRELTKIYESREVNKISQLLKAYENKNPKGEITILFNLKY